MKIVTNIEELKTAKKYGANEILVQGDLADKLRKSSQIAKVSKFALIGITGILGVAAVSAPISGGLSFAAAVPIATLTGVEIATIITASAIGLTLVIAIFKDYEEISYSSGKLKLKKKQK